VHARRGPVVLRGEVQGDDEVTRTDVSPDLRAGSQVGLSPCLPIELYLWRSKVDGQTIVAVAIAVIIAVLVYLAIGVVVLARLEGTSVPEQIPPLPFVDRDILQPGLQPDLGVNPYSFLRLIAILAWPALLVLRRRPPTSAPGESRPPPPEQGYVGGKGKAVTDLRPWGKVQVGERQFDARAETGFLAAGAGVNVVRVERGGLVVREVH
jgi:membrane protein implicated in regulation of membrane protease activity